MYVYAGPCSSAVDNLFRALRDPYYQWVIPLLSAEGKGKVFEGEGWVTTVMKLGKPKDIDQD